MSKSKIDVDKYLTALQTNIKLADTQFLYAIVARGVGKTTEALASRFLRVSYSLKQSLISLSGPTYKFVLDSIVPGILTHLNQYYIRGIHFEYNTRPPKHFKLPYSEITDWRHTISTAWGTVAKFIGIDRPDTSGVGQNFAHHLIDEGLRIKEDNYTERLLPALRGNKELYSHSPYFGGISLFSSHPNFINDNDWFMAQRDNMDSKLIKEIMDVQLDVDHAIEKFTISKDPTERKKLYNFILNWTLKLNEKRKGATYFVEGSSFTNLAVLGMDYMERQYLGAKNDLSKFKLSILGIRENATKNPFFSQFTPKNIYEDSFIYNDIDLYNLEGEREKTSRDLKYCDPNQALLMGLDPGDFMSCVFGQMKSVVYNKELRVFKNMWVISPNEHFELAKMINDYFKYHQSKTIYMHYDRAGNQRKDRYKDNPKGNTDATILKRYLEDLGWTIHLMSLDQRTLFYWEHYILQSKILGEKEKNVPRVKICQYECEELISSIQMTPRKKSDNSFIEMDKSAEKKLDKGDQIYYSPQIATAWMYLMWGLFEKYMPDTKPESIDFPGL